MLYCYWTVLVVHAEPLNAGQGFSSQTQQEALDGFQQREEEIIPASGWRMDQKAARGDVENQLCTATDQARSLRAAWFRVKEHRDGKWRVVRGMSEENGPQ